MKKLEALAKKEKLAKEIQREMMDMSFEIIMTASPYIVEKENNTITCKNAGMMMYIDFYIDHANIHEKDRPGYSVSYDDEYIFIAEISTVLERHRKMHE